MGFLAPGLLLGMVAAGIPIALHFFYRSRYRTVPWAAMSFLLTSIEQTSRRLRFQELLLLALRVLVLAVLAFALARPTAQLAGQGARGDAVDAIFVLDTSLSMNARAGVAPPAPGNDVYLTALKSFAKPDGSVTRFDRAKAAALAVLANLPPDSTVQVVTATGKGATLLGPRAPSQLDKARELLEGVERTDMGTDFLPALRMADDLVQRGSSPGKEVYLFSDMHKVGFDTGGPALVAALGDLSGHAAVHFVRCEQGRVANVSVVGITPQSTLQPGERASFAVLLRNRGQQPVRNLTVTLDVDGKKEQRESRAVDIVRPGESKAVLLSGVLDKPGFHYLTASVTGDDLEADNTFNAVLRVREAVGVLLVDGRPHDLDPKKAATFFLRHALDPGAGGDETLPVTVIPAALAEPRHLAGKDLCIVVNASLSVGPDEGGLSSEFVKGLAAFVLDRHPLLVFAGDRVEPTAYNRKFFDEVRLLPYKLTKVAEAPRGKAWTFDRTSGARVPYERFREDVGYANLDRIEVRKAVSLEEKDGEGTSVLLRYANRQPAVVSWQRPGQGEVVMFTTAVSDEAWTDLYLAPAFVPLVQVTLNHLLEARPEQYNGRAGEPIAWQPPPADGSRPFDLVRPNGHKVRLGYPESAGGRMLVTATATSQGGLYRLAPADGAGVGVPFAIAPDANETADLTVLPNNEIDQRLGFSPIHQTAGDEPASFSGADRLSREWTIWLLVALLTMVLIEVWLAWFCGRPLGSGNAPPTVGK